MMDFWPENQGHVPQYTKYGTLPGRNCTQNYHDKYQGTHYPLYYSEQQDQGRESSYWTVPGSRTGGSLQEYTNWNDPELAPPTASQFPFILDRHSQQHLEMREYQHQEARDREWTAIQRAAREYERGMMREGWQRRWESVSPVRYNRDVSKRNDSSYRELEAWAARYSHSLPRRRRIEAELRGASQGLLDKSRVMQMDNRSGADPRVAALPQLRPPTNIRESGLWDRGSRQQVPSYNPSSAPAPETSHSLDIKEKTSYQRRMFSQPPGYIAPPPYNTPHKNLPAMHQYDTSWEQELKRQTYQSQPKNLDFSKELHDMRKAEIESFTKPELKVYKQQKEPGVSSSVEQPECVLSLQQAIPETPNARINEAAYSKVIEGRKFRLNKKTGGMTIFCLVSRIAGTETDTPCLPLCTPQTNIHSTDKVSKSQDGTNVSQTLKLADEVDFRFQTQTSVQPSPQQEEAPICVQSESLGDNVDVSQQKTNEADSTFGRQAAHSLLSVPVKYPLWREPSFTNRADTDSSCVKADSDRLLKDEGPSDVDEGKQVTETESATESKDSNSTLLIDTTCVVVKMELIPSPKKDHVHYLSSDEHNPFNTQADVSAESVQCDGWCETPTESNPLKIHENKEPEMDSDVVEKKVTEDESGMSFLSIPSSLVSERETLEERAQRILGIPLDDDITEEQPGDETTCSDSSKKSHAEAVSPSTETSDINKATEQISQDTSENEESLKQTDDGLCSVECDDAKDQVMNECEGDFADPQDQVPTVSTQSMTELHPDADAKTSHESEITEDLECEFISGKKNENLLDENEYLNPLTDISNSFSLSTDCKEADSAYTFTLTSSDVSESNIQECPDPELSTLTTVTNLESPQSEAPPLPPTPSPVPSESDEHWPRSDSPADEPLELVLTLTDPIAEGLTEDNLCYDDQAQDGQITPLVNNGLISMELLTEDMTQQSESLQQNESACVKENNDANEHQIKEDSEVPTSLLDPVMKNDLQHMLGNGLTEDVSCVKESLMTEDKSKEGDQIPGQTKEDTTDYQTQRETEMLEQQFVKSEETAFATETHSTEDEEADENPSDFIEQPDLKENDEIDPEMLQHPPEFVRSAKVAFTNDTTDYQTQRETEMLEQQFVKSEETTFANETHSTEDEESEENPSDLIELDLKENDEIDTETLQHLSEFVLSAKIAFTNDTHTTEESFQEDAGEDLSGTEQTDFKENHCQAEKETETLPKQNEFVQSEKAAFVNETHKSEDGLYEEADEDPSDVKEQPEFKENDCQTKPEAGSPNPSSLLPTNSNHEVPQSPLDVPPPSQGTSPPQVTNSSASEFALEHASAGSSALDPVPETVPPYLHQDSCEQPCQFPAPFSSVSPPLPLSNTPPAHELYESISSNPPSVEQKEKPQYPKSLWDAVNRIRKHTAPDSENEEEEVADMWDPDNAAEDMTVDMDSVEVPSYCNGGIQEEKKPICDEAEQQVVLSVEDVQKEQSQQDPVHEESHGHVEEDTLSCSSNSSHESDDTVIVAEEDENVEAVTESRTDTDREFDKTDEEQSCSDEVRGEEDDDDKDGGKRSQTESCQREERPGEPVDMMETEQKGNEEGFVCTKAADEIVE